MESSFSNGSKSEKLLIDGNFTIPTLISGFVIRDFFSNKSKESSGGNVSFTQGIIPITGILVLLSIHFLPSSNSERSPLNLFIIIPLISFFFFWLH